MRLAARLLVGACLVGWTAGPARASLQEVESGAPGAGHTAESPYARWRNGPPTDPAWFPIGVWLQEPKLAERYAALGVNTFVGLWRGPTEEQLTLLSEAGMKIVCAPNAVGLRHRPQRDIIAWMQTDEPENRSSERSGPRATVAEAQANYNRLRRRDPSRPVWMNLGQGVANDAWNGLGAPRSDYPAYVAATDIVSFDVYPVTNLRRSDGENYLWYVAEGVRRLREWGADEKIVWNVIETTRGPQSSKKPTPAQVRAEVWLSLIAGSRGIVYFCHEFEEPRSSAALLLDAEMCAALTELNAEILALAPVLNRPSLEGRVRVTSSSPRVEVATLVKELEGALHVFAIATRNGPTRATLTLEGVSGATSVEVVGENRRHSLENGRFRDAFGPYAMHHYRIDSGGD